MNLPTEQQAQELFIKYNVPSNIKQHCEKVREVAIFLAQKLNENGLNLNIELIDKVALLHDLFKLVVLKTTEPNKFHPRKFTEEEIQMWKYLRENYPGMNEGDVTYEILKDKYLELSISIKNISMANPENLSPEEELIHYADWRVFRSELVPLHQKVAYVNEIYSHIMESNEKDYKKMLDFEERLRKFNIQI